MKSTNSYFANPIPYIIAASLVIGAAFAIGVRAVLPKQKSDKQEATAVITPEDLKAFGRDCFRNGYATGFYAKTSDPALFQVTYTADSTKFEVFLRIQLQGMEGRKIDVEQ